MHQFCAAVNYEGGWMGRVRVGWNVVVTAREKKLNGMNNSIPLQINQLTLVSTCMEAVKYIWLAICWDNKTSFCLCV